MNKSGCVVGVALAFALVLLAVTPAQAKAVLSAKTKAFAGKVEIDPKLNAYPKLYAYLLDEAKREFDAHRKEAEDQQRTDPAEFKERPWTFDVTYRLRSAVPRFVSVLRTDSDYSGGAHPNTEVRTVIWDLTAQQPAKLEDLFVEAQENGPTLTALAKLVRDSLAAAKRKRGIDVARDPATDEWLKVVVAKLDTLGWPSLAPSTIAGKTSGLTFHFSPYAVGPYAEGINVAFVPAAALAPYLKPELRPLFGGERPAKDAKQE